MHSTQLGIQFSQKLYSDSQQEAALSNCSKFVETSLRKYIYISENQLYKLRTSDFINYFLQCIIKHPYKLAPV